MCIEGLEIWKHDYIPLYWCPHSLLDCITSLVWHSGLKFPSLTWNVRVFIFPFKVGTLQSDYFNCFSSSSYCPFPVSHHSNSTIKVKHGGLLPLFHLKKETRTKKKKNQWISLNYLKGGYRKDRLFFEVHSNMMRGSEHMLQHGNIQSRH